MGVYGRMTLESMYQITQKGYDLAHVSLAWVEAENIMEIRSLMSNWFDAMEDGTANKRFQDPRGPVISLEEAERMIAEIDDDFNIESNRWRGLGVEAGPDYFRLEPHAKIAFVQQILMTIKSISQLEEEVFNRQKIGEQIPPKLFVREELPIDALGFNVDSADWTNLE